MRGCNNSKIRTYKQQIHIVYMSSNNVHYTATLSYSLPHYTKLHFTTLIDASHFYPLYRVIQKESAILWEMILCVILSNKVHMNMGPILNGYRDMVKRRYGPSCEHEQQLRNK